MPKPSHRRYKCEAAVTVRHLNDEETINGKMLNYSHNGLYFEADSFFATGSILHIRMNNGLIIHSNPGPEEKPHRVGIAEVRWCRPVQKDDDFCYGVGLRYR